MNKYQIVFVDIDDTLNVRNQPISERTKEVMKRIKEKNIPVISEIELAYTQTKIPFIAITGTIGPSNDGHILLIPESIQVHKMGSESNTLLN